MSHQPWRRRWAVIASLSVTGALLAGCAQSAPPSSDPTADERESGDYSALYSEAKKESGTLLVYTNQQPQTGEDFTAEWSALFPEAPKLQVAVYAGADAATRYGSERQSGSCAPGVYLGDIKAATTFGEKDWLLKQTDTTLPQRKNYEDKFKTEFYTIAAILPHVVFYNTDNVKEKPATLEALFNEENKGRLGLGDPRAQMPDLAAMNVIRQQFGEKGLKKLAALDPKYFNSAVPGTAAVASGEINFYYPTYPILYTAQEKAGAPVGMFEPKGLSGAFPVVAISDGSGCKLQATAALFSEFVLSPAGQAILSGQYGNGSGNSIKEDFQGARKKYAAPRDLGNVVVETPATLEAVRSEVLASLGLQ